MGLIFFGLWAVVLRPYKWTEGERSVSALTRGTRTARWLKRSCVGLGTRSGAILSSTRCSLDASAGESTRSGSDIAPNSKHAGRWHRQLEPNDDAECSDLGARLPWTDDEVKASPMKGKGPRWGMCRGLFLFWCGQLLFFTSPSAPSPASPSTSLPLLSLSPCLGLRRRKRQRPPPENTKKPGALTQKLGPLTCRGTVV